MIRYFDYRPALAEIRADIEEAVRRVLDSGQLILGPEVAAFEREFAAWLGTSEAVGVNSGTDALILALRALGIGAGDEVLTVANAGVPPVAAIRAVGAIPRFVDVCATTLLLDPSALEAARTQRTRAVLPVHLYGQPADLDPILDFAGQHGLAVVEDCAQAHGAMYGTRRAGTLGDVGCFSFYPTKNLAALGDGGLVTTDRAPLLDELRMLRMYGFRGDRSAHREGLNSRLDELQAAFLRIRLGRLDQDNERRVELADRYLRGLAGWDGELPAPAAGRSHVYHLFVVRPRDRSRAQAALEQAGIGYGLHYPEPVHLMEAYRDLGPGPGALPVTERTAGQVLSLPLYPGLAADDVDQVVRALLAA